MKYLKKYRNPIFILSLSFVILLIADGCKPTEKGYKAAYDAAVSKREKAQEDFNPNLAVGGIIQDADGPLLRTVNGHDVYLLSENLKVLPETPAEKQSYNVAVGCFKMPTNCLAFVSDLRKQGIEAFGAKNAEDKYYVIIGSFSLLDEAVECVVQYGNANPSAYVGLPDAPVIIFSN